MEPTEWPSVSLLIAAYNEEDVIEERVRNALAMDYPRDRLEIVIALDGCDDRTSAIVRRYEGEGVRLLDYTQRRGKSAVLNAAFNELEGEIVMLSDANTEIDPQAARRLVRWFRHSPSGCRLRQTRLDGSSNRTERRQPLLEVETFLKRCEGRLGALLGANGAIYAIRKDRFRRSRTTRSSTIS